MINSLGQMHHYLPQGFEAFLCSLQMQRVYFAASTKKLYPTLIYLLLSQLNIAIDTLSTYINYSFASL